MKPGTWVPMLKLDGHDAAIQISFWEVETVKKEN